MLGTIVNATAILVGSSIGSIFKQSVKEKYRKVLFNALGLASIMLGVNASVGNMHKSEFPVLFIISLAVGSVVGTYFDFAGKLDQFEQRRRAKRKQSDDAPRLVEGLTTGCLLFCIGTFSIVGPVLSALEGNNTFLYTNATLDFVSSMVLAAVYGWGMMLAAPILFCWQGMFYVIALVFREAMPEPMRVELSIVGGVLILCSGLSLLNIKDCKTVNLLPSLLVPVLFYLVKGCF
ncbi:MAG: DUF554 domain-containing protein [Paludibacteraceae bacterium]|nr:DUF554 domain-containing protein [Paludibacteraceae bacterium]